MIALLAPGADQRGVQAFPAQQRALRLAGTGLQVLDVEVLRIRPDKDPAEALRILDAAAELDATYALVSCNDPDRARLTDRI